MSILTDIMEKIVALNEQVVKLAAKEDTHDVLRYKIVKTQSKYAVYRNKDGVASGFRQGTFDTLEKAVDYALKLQERDLPYYRVWDTVWDMLVDQQYFDDSEYWDVYMYDYMISQDMNYFVVNHIGKLYRVEYSLDADDNITIDNVVEVKVAYDFVEQQQNKITIKRSVDGTLKWYGIISSAVLNRSGELDTTELFDDFERNFDQYEKPFLTLQHMGEVIQFGTLDGILRYNAFLIGYGVIDESTTLGKHAEKRFSEGGWGFSIGYWPHEMPKLLKINDSIQIRTFNKGHLAEVSVLKEERAASLFTLPYIVNRENKIMGHNRESAKKIILEFTGGEDEDEVEGLMDNMDVRQREIEETGMITRDNEDEEKTEQVEEVSEVIEEEVVEESEEQEENANLEIEISDDVLQLLTEAISARISATFEHKFAEIEEMKRSITKMTEDIERMDKIFREIEEHQESFTERLEAVERSDENKLNEALADVPSSVKRKITVTHRPTQDNSDNENKTNNPLDLNAISRATLEEQGVDYDKYSAKR